MMKEGFGGESYTGGGYDNSDLGGAEGGYSQQKRVMRKLGVAADNNTYDESGNQEIYQSNNNNGNNHNINNGEEDETNRV